MNREKEQGVLVRGGTRPTRCVCDVGAEASISRRVAAPLVPIQLPVSENVCDLIFWVSFIFYV